MSTKVLDATSPVAIRYWLELKGLSDNVKLELITLLSSSMVHPEATSVISGAKPFDRRANAWQEEDNAKLDAFLASVSGDWGGDASPSEIADGLRQGAEMVRKVDTW